jgi:GNAT superfamily N-acetyltransferase
VPDQPPSSVVTVRPVERQDRARWRELYLGYLTFYRVSLSEQQLELVWSWLHEPDHEVEGLVAVGADGSPVGLAHYRQFARPLGAGFGGYLDDLFVDPDQRGQGAADALLAELRTIAARRSWSVVRWMTADDNYRGRAKYDQVATRTSWVTYDMSPVTADD